jgi:acetyl-CoA/propionyl-CoA carboxylase, biotin carboxylase, biotin carboxyl carrier protein
MSTTPATASVTARPFGSLLVANRGEIAVRILRSARAAGLQTVAVYSDADREAPHVREADLAVRLGPAPAPESYLSVPALLEAARRSGAEAVHPGYGFLSERAHFARACEEAGLVFVGPPADVIDRMGRKDVARHVAVVADVPVMAALEESDGERDDGALAARAAAEVGFPLLVKAAAGGGGKGMRVVRAEADLAGALAAARREAASAFGDDTMLFERYVERGRHVEVQVLADAHGTVLHLFERDCSAQRRHQKVIEEAPAPTISADLRERLTSAAVRLSREVGYVGAGTVEFLVSGEEAFFLEMNTRLQVEHPVTELVTGLDLVRLQLDVAQGRPLPIAQEDVRLSGHAVEARVYAEDPAAGFLPQAGVATAVRWSPRARVDHALESGQEVSTHYDPMLGKVIASGPTREAARRSLVAALDDTAVLGLTTNLGFLRRLVASDAFRDADIDTGWLDRAAADGPVLPAQMPDVVLALAAWARAAAPAGRDPRHPFGALDGYRVAGPDAPVVVELDGAGERYVLRVDVAAGEIRGRVGGDERRWEAHPLAADLGGDGPAPGRGAVGQLRLEVDGVLVESEVELTAGSVTVAHHGEAYRFTVPDAFGPAHAAAASDGAVSAPMPGVVLAVNVAEGDRVEGGAVLGVVEAMKMELALPAPLTGTVTTVGAAAGDRVALGQTLFEVAPDPQEG